MMTCGEEGRLMAYLDGELDGDEREAVVRHLDGCHACRGTAARLDAGRAAAHAALAAAGLTTGEYRSQAGRSRRDGVWRRHRRLVAAAALAVACGTALGLPSVRSAAAEFLSVFRVEQVQLVTLRPGDIERIEAALRSGQGQVDLRQFGSVEFSGGERSGPLDEKEALSRLDGTPLPRPDRLPDGFGAPSYHVKSAATVRFTLNTQAVNSLSKSLGSGVSWPAAADGRPILVDIPTTVFVRYPAVDPGRLGLEIIRLPAPRVKVPEGVDPEAIRGTLLALPILPQELRDQLAAIRDWRNTLVLPAMEGQAKRVQVNGKPAVYTQQGDVHTQRGDAPAGGNLIWVEDGLVTILSGPLGPEEAVALAESLR